MKTLLTIACSIFFSASCDAQSAAPPPPPSQDAVKFFRLEFSVKELDNGRIVNSRKYIMTIAANADRSTGTSSMRSGAKIPMHSGSSQLTSTQFTYVDVGVNIDCNQAKEVAGGLSLNVTGDLNSTAAGQDTSLAQPVIRTNRWSSSVIVPIRKSTVIFSSDDPATNHQMQLELLATPIV